MKIKNSFALKKLNAVVVDAGNADNKELAMTLNVNIMNLGFVMSAPLFDAVASLSDKKIEKFATGMVRELKYLVGANVRYQPMYPNFPQQVIEADDYELLYNALLHYWSFGEILPEYEEKAREFSFEKIKLKTIGLATQAEFDAILTKLLSSADSISDEDKEIIEWFNENHPNFESLVPSTIPHKENMSLVAGMRVKQGDDITSLVKTGTDVMRVYAYLSDADVSLTDKVKFKSMPKKVRRQLTLSLEKVLNDEDLARRPNEFVRMSHSLHVGDFSNEVWQKVNKVRDNKRRGEIETFSGKIESAIIAKDFLGASKMLKSRPGEFARRISELIDKSGEVEAILRDFTAVVDHVPTRVLAQVWGYVNSRRTKNDKMFVMPKGASTQNAMVIKKPKNAWSSKTVDDFEKVIRDSLLSRFSKLDKLGKVYVDPALMGCPLPTQMRSTSKAVKTLARGTRMPFGDDKGTLRFFIYWKGMDIDLSATFHGEDFEMRDQVSYTNLRSEVVKAYHSGDITRAPTGASEFIDIDIDSALAAGHRYVAMNVYVFNGPSFAEHEICYAGWMTRSKPKSNEIYDPKTVVQKADLTSESRNAIPAVFDLQTREVIWLDMSTSGRLGYSFESSWGRTGRNIKWRGGNNVEANKATTSEMIEFFTMRNNKISLYELFETHGAARGELVTNRDEADYVFAWDGDTTPFDIMDINSMFVID